MPKQCEPFTLADVSIATAAIEILLKRPTIRSVTLYGDRAEVHVGADELKQAADDMGAEVAITPREYGTEYPWRAAFKVGKVQYHAILRPTELAIFGYELPGYSAVPVKINAA